MLRATTSLSKQSFAFVIFFTALFSCMTNKNLQQHHCNSTAMHWWWQQELSKRLQYVICIVCFGRDIHCKAIQHFRFSCAGVGNFGKVGAGYFTSDSTTLFVYLSNYLRSTKSFVTRPAWRFLFSRNALRISSVLFWWENARIDTNHRP